MKITNMNSSYKKKKKADIGGRRCGSREGAAVVLLFKV